MPSLELHHIVALQIWVASHLPKQTQTKGGRPPVLRDSDLVTLLIWNTLILRQKTLKGLWRCGAVHLAAEFPHLGSYPAFVAHCHRVLPHLWMLLRELLCDSQVRIVDSTMLPVCKIHRADRHKVAKNVASFGKNYQGWHYGFKLHTSVTLDGKLCETYFTPASEYDAQVLPELVNHRTLLAIGDTLYGATVMLEETRKKAPSLIVLSPPFPKQKKKIIARWQKILLDWRSKIETVFDQLKEHLHLVSSFPRSVNGYLLHYISILLGYQILALSCAE
jgi:hypothetical protein